MSSFLVYYSHQFLFNSFSHLLVHLLFSALTCSLPSTFVSFVFSLTKHLIYVKNILHAFRCMLKPMSLFMNHCYKLSLQVRFVNMVLILNHLLFPQHSVLSVEKSWSRAREEKNNNKIWTHYLSKRICIKILQLSQTLCNFQCRKDRRELVNFASQNQYGFSHICIWYYNQGMPYENWIHKGVLRWLLSVKQKWKLYDLIRVMRVNRNEKKHQKLVIYLFKCNLRNM